MKGVELQPDVERGRVWLNVGPQHPATHGVFRCLLQLEGEVIVDARPVIGYLHRGTEKIAEHRAYFQIIPYLDRTDYLAAMAGNLGVCLAVEKLAGIEVPKRAQYLRVLAVELNRIASHLVWLGTWGLDLGVLTPFLWCFREREKILKMLEMMSGARLTYSYIRYGGVRDDLIPEFFDEFNKFRRDFPHFLDELEDLLNENEIFVARTKGIGIIPREKAINYGLSGPVLRASGVPHDLRKAQPYSSYEDFDFEIAVAQEGDCYARYVVRMKEMRESLKICEQAVEGLPEGPFTTVVGWFFKAPKGSVYHAVETPRGELGVYVVSDGQRQPYRFHLRSPSFCNLSILPEVVKGYKIGDFVAILGSLDPVFGDVDR